VWVQIPPRPFAFRLDQLGDPLSRGFESHIGGMRVTVPVDSAVTAGETGRPSGGMVDARAGSSPSLNVTASRPAGLEEGETRIAGSNPASAIAFRLAQWAEP
jgi:hypothetical protein